MAVSLSVSEIRQAIWLDLNRAEATGPGLPSTMTLGSMFHDVFADLVSADAQLNFRAAIESVDPHPDQWRAELITHAWRRLVGPRLRQRQAQLHMVTEQVLDFWDAVREMCQWLSSLLWQAHQQGLGTAQMAALMTAEQKLDCILNDETWTDEVHLVGSADSVCRVPSGDKWCVIELKTGRTAPQADLAQVCLYHQMLAASEPDSSGALVLISFHPRIQERLFHGHELMQAQQTLKNLIGRLAGVIREETTVVNKPVVVKQIEEVKPPEPDQYSEQAAQLEQIFALFGLNVGVSRRPIVSPTFLRFPIEPRGRVTLRAIRNTLPDVQARLGFDTAPHLSQERGRVALDVQRPADERETVFFSQIREQLPAADELFGCSRIPAGVDISGRLRTIDFSHHESPHLLVAGTTGSGKSEWMRAAIAGLLLTNTPATMQLALVDPKRLAFHQLRNSPFLRTPIVYSSDPEHSAITVLDSLVAEMESRYRLMQEAGADNLTEYIRRLGQPVPRLFFICDEYADLMMGDRAERKALEHQIRRLGQKARAAGIHIILATQRPSTDIVTPAIKTNLPARLALRVASDVESRMMLGENGAESLLGRGDMLLRVTGAPVRLQSPFLPSAELAQIFGASEHSGAAS